jgi:hypothetical protein
MRRYLLVWGLARTAIFRMMFRDPDGNQFVLSSK